LVTFVALVSFVVKRGSDSGVDSGVMQIRRVRWGAAALFTLALCAGAAAWQGPSGQSAPGATPAARPDLVRQPFNEADVEFMAGMIPHHAQAVLISEWAVSHGASPEIRVLCEKIVVAQRDEIELMRNWLRDRGRPVPAPDATHHRMKMNGVEHDMLMPGMLTADDLAQLDKARGPEWDRLFLKGMIRHHEGALTMVGTLFEAFGALQDDDLFKFASDLYADQSTEIERMQKLLDLLERKPR
jgi:uncharacterized protein (DUF305 family)